MCIAPISGLAAAFALAMSCGASPPPKEKRMDEKQVLEWVREAPFSDPAKLRAHPQFSYEDWMARGRRIPNVIDTLTALLQREDLERPSGDGMRLAYALGWIGDRRKPAVDALVRCLGSRDIALRIEAVAALGRIGDASVAPLLEGLVKDRAQDKNIRGNACVALGRLGLPRSEPVLRDALNDPDRFIVRCAEEGLKLLRAGAPR